MENTPGRTALTSKRLAGVEKQKLIVLRTCLREGGAQEASPTNQNQARGSNLADLPPGTHKRWKFCRTKLQKDTPGRVVGGVVRGGVGLRPAGGWCSALAACRRQEGDGRRGRALERFFQAARNGRPALFPWHGGSGTVAPRGVNRGGVLSGRGRSGGEEE